MRSRFILLSGIFALLPACRLEKSSIETATNYTQLREKMVREQIVAEGIRDPAVLKAMAKIPRHEFIPEAQRRHAYENGPVTIGYGQTISQPYVVAYMSEALQLQPGLTVLEIGTGSAYQTAILAETGVIVHTIEIVPELCASAAAILKKLGYLKVQTRCGNGYLGWPEAAPFDRIVLTAAPAKLPDALLQQLKDGGVLVAPVGGLMQDLVRITRRGTEYKEQKLLPVRFVPMVGNE